MLSVGREAKRPLTSAVRRAEKKLCRRGVIAPESPVNPNRAHLVKHDVEAI